MHPVYTLRNALQLTIKVHAGAVADTCAGSKVTKFIVIDLSFIHLFAQRELATEKQLNSVLCCSHPKREESFAHVSRPNVRRDKIGVAGAKSIAADGVASNDRRHFAPGRSCCIEGSKCSFGDASTTKGGRLAPSAVTRRCDFQDGAPTKTADIPSQLAVRTLGATSDTLRERMRLRGTHSNYEYSRLEEACLHLAPFVGPRDGCICDAHIPVESACMMHGPMRRRGAIRGQTFGAIAGLQNRFRSRRQHAIGDLPSARASLRGVAVPSS
ncbi:hypothetical protein IE81DRAFT_69636 [Ceraceosorus guamensis]|uniref:Uncharacterized protein n=1 Tax=Ceraceosorus guamensis TaxID=1522189 RepID=A0A316VP51_9BASI|nr:hypothetical protein IE81DRAFT_69636 [Ceraceosorus guamensis]PWN38848.1 hypothetical protein IE81DRAFT_69636 [Ceraceosorus guamensis]